MEIEGPEIEGPEGGFKMPKFNMPSFGMKGPKLEGPDVDVKILKADIDLNAPEFDIEGPEGKNQGLQIQDAINLWSKDSMPDVDFNLKGPKLKGDV